MVNWLPLLIFISLLVLAWRSPKSVLLVVLAAIPAYVVKFTIGPIPTNLIELAIWAVAIGWLIRDPAKHFRQFFSGLRPLLWPLMLLGVGLVVGTVVSTHLTLSLGIVKGWFIDPLIVLGLVLALFSSKDIRKITLALLVSTLPITLAALYQVVTGHYVTIDERASAWFGSANFLSLYLVPLLLLGAGLLFDANAKLFRWIYWVITGLGLIALYFSYSYGGWLALVAGALVIGIWMFRRRWQLWLAGGAIILAIGLTQLFFNPRVARMLDLAQQSSSSVRLQIWTVDWALIKTHWLAGIGLGQYPFKYGELAPQLFRPPLEPSVPHAHNLFFQFWLNLGLAGIVGLVWLIVNFFRTLPRAVSSWQAPLAAGMTAVLVHGLVDTPYWKNDLSLIFWVLIALVYLASRSDYVRD